MKSFCIYAFAMLFHLSPMQFGWLDSGFDIKYDRLTPEEAGYIEEYETVIAKTRDLCEELKKSLSDAEHFVEMGDNTKAQEKQADAKKKLESLKKISRERLDALSSTAPPSEERFFKDFHQRFVEFLQALRRKSNAPDAKNICKIFYIEVKKLVGKVNERPEPDSPSFLDTAFDFFKNPSLSYSPPGVPMAISVDKNFNISTKFGKAITTPFGNLKVGFRRSSGVKMLVIEKGSSRRFFKLDGREFRILVHPKSYCEIRKNEGDDKLIIGVY